MRKLRYIPLGIILVLFITIANPKLGTFAATSPTLGAAASYSVLAGSTVTNTGATTISGDVGVAPGSSITGFPPGVINSPGTIHTNDTSAQNAQAAVTTAFASLVQSCDFNYGDGTNLTVLSPLVPGVYCSSGSFTLSGNLSLTGTGVWIFEAASTFITASNSSVTGGDPCNVWWRVGSSATLGTSSNVEGNILALSSITLNTGAILNGRALAQSGAVTLDGNTVGSICTAPTATSTNTLVDTSTATSTNTPTNTSTATNTSTSTNTSTATRTLTPTDTSTATTVVPNTSTPVDTSTSTSTLTPTNTPTDTSTVQDSPTPTDTPTVQDSPTPTDTSTVQDTPTQTETTVVQDTPTQTETTVVQDTPTPTETTVVQDTPTQTETTVVQDTPTQTETTVVQDTPTQTETTVVQDTPTQTETTVVQNTPTQTETTEAQDTPTPTSEITSVVPTSGTVTVKPKSNPTAKPKSNSNAAATLLPVVTGVPDTGGGPIQSENSPWNLVLAVLRKLFSWF